MANQKSDPQDILIVKNIDVDCSEISSDVLPVTRRLVDPETGQASTIYDQVVEEYNHKDYFQCKFSGKPFRIKPGETRRMPRFIAEDHFAKHLADHILQKRNKPINSSTERPRVLKEIIIGVDEYYLQDDVLDEGSAAQSQVDKLNPIEEAKAINMGIIPPDAVGKLVPEGPSLDDILKNAKAASKSVENPILPTAELTPTASEVLHPPIEPQKPPQTIKRASTQEKTAKVAKVEAKTSIFDKDKPLPSQEELIKAAYELGLPVTGQETPEQLVAMLKKF
mgnify:FL=1